MPDRFDRIARVAARTFDVPVAGLSVLDRQWAAATLGVEPHDDPRLRAFAARAFAADAPLVVERAEDGEAGAGLRFAAGVVVHGPCGRRVGTLCIGDARPRTFGPDDVDVLLDLAGWAEHELAGSDLGAALRSRTETEQRLQALMSTVPDGVVSFGEDGIIESVNPAAERMFGLPEGYLVGERVDKLLHRLNWRELEGMLKDGPHSVLGLVTEVTGRRSDYSPFPLELSVARTRVGRRTLYVAVGRDITERRASEDALERVRLQNELLLESAGDGVIGIDRAGKVTFVNPAAAEMLRRYAFEMVGLPLHEVLRAIVGGAVVRFEQSAAYKTIADGEPRRAERVLTRDDGSTFPAELSVAATRAGGEVTGAVVMVRDVSERYAVDRMKDEFISVVGHELRTPLTSIRGSLGLLAGGVLGELPEQAERMLSIAISNTDRLVRLINDILDIERIEAGRIELDLEPQSARALLEETVEVVGAMAVAKDVTLRIQAGDQQVLGDHDRLVQALTNLVSNAVKFSPQGEEVTLTARTVQAGVKLEVRDHGRGIPAEHLERVFDRFHQVDASDARDLGGTGLGLTTARSIVDQHGGQIWAESTPGEGATFVIGLPALRAEHDPSELAPAAGPKNVLVVEDDPDLGRVLVRLLDRQGVRAKLARTGRQALELIERRPPDLLVLDVLVPETDGFALVDELRADERLRSIPLVVYTAVDLDADDRERLQLGRTTIMTKGRSTPADVEEHVLRLLEAPVPAGVA